LNRESEETPRAFFPTRLRKKVKRKTVSTISGMEIDKKRREVLYGMMGFMKKTGITHNTGCRKEEKSMFHQLVKDTVENTTKRRTSTTQNPRKKPLGQMFQFLRTLLRILPRKIMQNHMKLEKRESPEHLLKLKIGSVRMKIWLIKQSEKSVITKTAIPKIKPSSNP